MRRAFGIVPLGLLVAGCPPPNATIKVTSIVVDSAGSATSIGWSDTLQFTASVLPAKATNKGVTWKVVDQTSGDPASATITTGGLLTGTTTSGENVTVIATAKDGSGVTGTFDLTIMGS